MDFAGAMAGGFHLVGASIGGSARTLHQAPSELNASKGIVVSNSGTRFKLIQYNEATELDWPNEA